jgi:hypothetical protein
LIREVLLHPHPLLTRRAEPATDPGAVVADLLDTMRAFGHCIGLAAPQIGESVRVAVVDCTGHRKAPDAHGELILVNPVIVAADGSEVGREGCLSIPRADRQRAPGRAHHRRGRGRARDGGGLRGARGSSTRSTTSTGYCSSTACSRRPTCSGASGTDNERSIVADIEAHITGTVWKVEVAVGDAVAEGDTVAILESMKMEMPVEAEDEGHGQGDRRVRGPGRSPRATR